MVLGGRSLGGALEEAGIAWWASSRCPSSQTQCVLRGLAARDWPASPGHLREGSGNCGELRLPRGGGGEGGGTGRLSELGGWALRWGDDQCCAGSHPGVNAVPWALLGDFYKAIFLLSLVRNCGGNIVLFFFSGQPAQPPISVNSVNSLILFHWLLGLAPSNLGLQELASQVGSINYPLALMASPA